MTDNTELLPCPFCGGEAVIVPTLDTTVREWFVTCGNLECNVLACHTKRYYTEAEAIAAWNTRTATTDADFSRAVHDGNLWRRVKGHVRCNYCGLNIESVIALDGCNSHAIKHCPNCGRKVVSA